MLSPLLIFMTRPLRIEYDNAFYHVINRGKGRQLALNKHNVYLR